MTTEDSSLEDELRDDRDRSWQVSARCRGYKSYLFLPPEHSERQEEREQRERSAIAICSVCPVKQECLEFALGREPYGIWGGLTEGERRQMVSAQKRADKAKSQSS